MFIPVNSCSDTRQIFLIPHPMNLFRRVFDFHSAFHAILGSIGYLVFCIRYDHFSRPTSSRHKGRSVVVGPLCHNNIPKAPQKCCEYISTHAKWKQNRMEHPQAHELRKTKGRRRTLQREPALRYGHTCACIRSRVCIRQTTINVLLHQSIAESVQACYRRSTHIDLNAYGPEFVRAVIARLRTYRQRSRTATHRVLTCMR